MPGDGEDGARVIDGIRHDSGRDFNPGYIGDAAPTFLHQNYCIWAGTLQFILEITEISHRGIFVFSHCRGTSHGCDELLYKDSA